MRLFTKEIDKKLFEQFEHGSDLSKQKVIAKIYNPTGRGTWYIINSDENDPDYLWAIVDLFEVEAGSVSRSELESIKVPPFRLPLERDMYFTPINAAELYRGLLAGKRYAEGGEISIEAQNKDMLLNYAEELEHHVKEFEEAAKKAEKVMPWVIAKIERSSTDLSDVTHYLASENEKRREYGNGEGEEEYADGGEIKWQDAHYGDNALVVSENKMGIIIKPYGRKFHLKFADGTEKTYDASELKFFSDVDDFDRGGKLDVGRYYKTTDGRQVRYLGDTKDPEVGTFTNKSDGVFMVRYDEIEGKASLFDEGGEVEEGVDLFEDYDDIPSNVQEVLDKYSDAFEDGDYKQLEKANKELGKIGYTFEYGLDGQAYDLRKIGEKGKSEYMAKGGEISVKVGDKVKSKSGIEGEVYESTGMFFKLKDKYGNKGQKFYSTRDFKPSEIKIMADSGMMANGGQTDFGDFYDWSSKEVNNKFNSQFDEGFPIVKFVKDSINKVVESASGVLKNGKTVVFNVDSVEWEQSDKMADGGMMEKGGDLHKDSIYLINVTTERVSKRSKGAAYNDKGSGANVVRYTLQEVTGDIKDLEKNKTILKITNQRLRSLNERGGKLGLNAVGALNFFKKYGYDFKIDPKLLKGNEDMDLKKVSNNLYLEKNKRGTNLSEYYGDEPAFVDSEVKKRFEENKQKEMAMGGKVKFADKVKSIKKSLLERKKVSPKVQKDYGKTYSPKEAEESAKRIVGAMTAKERLMAKRKKSKK